MFLVSFLLIYISNMVVNSFREMYARSDTFFCEDLPPMYKMAENIIVK